MSVSKVSKAPFEPYATRVGRQFGKEKIFGMFPNTFESRYTFMCVALVADVARQVFYSILKKPSGSAAYDAHADVINIETFKREKALNIEYVD
jgi:hypothetical protein